MTRALPPTPSLEALKKQAKAILKAHKAGDPSCCKTPRKLRQFADQSDADVLAAGLKLTEAQYAVAMDYGVDSWAELSGLCFAFIRESFPASRPSGFSHKTWTNSRGGGHLAQRVPLGVCVYLRLHPITFFAACL